jgi:hypothetical protein
MVMEESTNNEDESQNIPGVGERSGSGKGSLMGGVEVERG